MIVGLGNPGPLYSSTRHNLGFMVADALAALLGVRFAEGPGEFLHAHAPGAGPGIWIVRPLTYMNGSGAAAGAARGWTGIPAERMLVVLDDFQIPLGTIRMRPGGSDGGHHGLGSVLRALGTEAVPRLRCGIGPSALPPREERRDFVLAPFAGEERAPARAMVARAAEAARMFALSGINAAMTAYNSP